MSAVGIGAWQLGGRAWNVDVREVLSAVERAVELGVDLVDTAEIYGAGRSELMLGELVRRRDVTVATKVGGHNYGRVEKAARASLARLGRIDLYQLHWPPPPYAPLCRPIRDMERLVDTGLVREIGLSNFAGRLLEEALACAKRHEPVSVQVHYNPLYRRAELEVFPIASRAGLTVMSWSPLAKGAALGRWGPDRARKIDGAARKRASTEWGRRVVETVRRIAEARSASPAAVVLAWHKAKGALPIPGVKSPAQAEALAEALRLDLDEGEVRAIDGAAGPQALEGGLVPRARLLPATLQRLLLSLYPI